MPGRATDLDTADEEDPYRVILFSDIQPFLFPVKHPEVRLQLIYAFLSFLGLPFTPPDVPSTSASTSDPHFLWALAHNSRRRSAFWPTRASSKQLAWQTVGGEPMDPAQTRALQDPFPCPIRSWAQGRGTLFAQTGKWFQDMQASDMLIVDATFVK